MVVLRPVDLLGPQYLQRALLAIALLAVAGGLLGSWVVLRRLAFFTHAAGTATFPGLVVAGPLGVPAALAAAGASLLFAGAVAPAARSARIGTEAATGLGLAGALALGVVLASDVLPAGADVDSALFGTLLGLSTADLAAAAAVSLAAAVATLAGGRAWLAAGFDPGSAASLGVDARRADALLLVLVALTVVAALPAVGALLVSAVLVVPAATARLLARSVRGLQAWAVGIALAQGVAGLLLADRLDVPPGPAVAATGAAIFAVVATVRR